MSIFLRSQTAGQYELVDGGQPLSEPNQFLEALALRGLSSATRRSYGFDLVVLYRWLTRTGRKLPTLSARDLLDWIAAQRAAGAQPSTINRRLTSCRLVYRFCTDRDLDQGPGFVGPAPHYRGRGRDRYLGLHGLSRPQRLKLRVKTPHRIVEPLSATEVRHFLRSLRRYRDLAIVQMMLLCGLRSAEVLQLRCDDVALDEGRLRVHGKGDKERIVPLPALLARTVTDYLHWERPVECVAPQIFVVLQGTRRAQPMTPAGLRSLFRFRRRDRQVARANAHRFRHTFGADMARAGVRLPILQRMMGHADGMTTLKYIHLSMADIADEYQRAMREIERRYRGGA